MPSIASISYYNGQMDAETRCPITWETPPVNPVQVSCCGRLFSADGLKNWLLERIQLGHSIECVICRSALDPTLLTGSEIANVDAQCREALSRHLDNAFGRIEWQGMWIGQITMIMVLFYCQAVMFSPIANRIVTLLDYPSIHRIEAHHDLPLRRIIILNCINVIISITITIILTRTTT